MPKTTQSISNIKIVGNPDFLDRVAAALTSEFTIVTDSHNRPNSEDDRFHRLLTLLETE